MSIKFVDELPRVNHQPIESVQQSADANQATLLAIQLLAQQLKEIREHSDMQLETKLREQREHFEVKLRE